MVEAVNSKGGCTQVNDITIGILNFKKLRLKIKYNYLGPTVKKKQ
jgi:hypothetical protein